MQKALPQNFTENLNTFSMVGYWGQSKQQTGFFHQRLLMVGAAGYFQCQPEVPITAIVLDSN